MKSTLILILSLTLVSCVSSKYNGDRELASRPNLSGTYLGVASYKGKLRKPAVRIYLDEAEGGTYNVVLLEYVNLLGILPKYIASNKLPKLSKVIGFLNSITEKITVYKAVPSSKSGHYDLLELRAGSQSIKVVESANPRQLVLSDKRNLTYSLEGAYITQVKKSQARKIFFPIESSKKSNGIEYATAKLVYEKIGLDSTWRKSFLPGPYLSAYSKRDDVVLDLVSEKTDKAYFRLNTKIQFKGLSKIKRQRAIKKREKVFTNPKSAFLEGGFVVIEPIDGMFVLSPMDSNKNVETNREMKGRIGLFIDIFDATQKLNQDVVELALINPADPSDFHMHYEDPDNGEGK